MFDSGLPLCVLRRRVNKSIKCSFPPSGGQGTTSGGTARLLAFHNRSRRRPCCPRALPVVFIPRRGYRSLFTAPLGVDENRSSYISHAKTKLGLIGIEVPDEGDVCCAKLPEGFDGPVRGACAVQIHLDGDGIVDARGAAFLQPIGIVSTDEVISGQPIDGLGEFADLNPVSSNARGGSCGRLGGATGRQSKEEGKRKEDRNPTHGRLGISGTEDEGVISRSVHERHATLLYAPFDQSFTFHRSVRCAGPADDEGVLDRGHSGVVGSASLRFHLRWSFRDVGSQKSSAVFCD